MQFYTNLHPFYCGIDLHARMLCVCILDERGDILVHKNIKDSPEQLLTLLSPYLGNIVVGAECMHCWYWLSDFCEQHNIDFILGHALYMKAIHGGKTKNDKIDAYKIAKLMRGYFPDPLVQRSVDMNLRLIEIYAHEVSSIECHVEKITKNDNGREYHLLRSLPGVGRVLALTILYEIGNIQRFESVQKFVSYSRLVKCKAESAGKTYGTQGNKIGNAHLKLAFSEAAVLFLKGNPPAHRHI